MKGDVALKALHRAMLDAGVTFVADDRTPYRQRYDLAYALERRGYPLKKVRRPRPTGEEPRDD